ncbi:hypothetical protein N7478_012934 [Penicillium angulare]|uniref:uncharacterized protein n=1 Tax=Penicillium angulare TaxID=116970 RepID=UPI0025417A05|nr:uncharacterized protein N7478_012934 [Penicillium angulare]KAJ5256830.1 hypothetical protein N7478_012934 [Penicillium angulare]
MSSISCRPDNLATTLATGPQALDMDDQLGLLPPLFNDDLNSFEFENIFSGDSDIELNNFFGDIFSLPSYPPVTIPEDLIPVVDALSDRPAPVFQRYSSDAQV